MKIVNKLGKRMAKDMLKDFEFLKEKDPNLDFIKKTRLYRYLNNETYFSSYPKRKFPIRYNSEDDIRYIKDIKLISNLYLDKNHVKIVDSDKVKIKELLSSTDPNLVILGQNLLDTYKKVK